MKTMLLFLATLTLTSCAFLKTLATPIPHEHVIPDGNGGYRVYKVK